MPADPRRARVGRRRAGRAVEQHRRRRIRRCAPLTDIFALPAWLPFANVFSIGDVLIGDRASRSRSRRRCAPRRRSPSRVAVTLPDSARACPRSSSGRRSSTCFLVVVLRISGKREVGQMSILELIVILVISDAVQNSMVGENTTLWGGLVAVLTLLGLDSAQVARPTGRGASARSSRASRACSSATAGC